MDPIKTKTDLLAWYGAGEDGSCPTAEQWERLLSRPADRPVTLVNFFKIRGEADYETGEQGISGQDAFSRYAAISIPTMERVGGKFLYVGPCQGAFLGEEEDWDLIAVGSYPDLEALVALYSDEGYRAVFHHRAAACEKQKVLVAAE